MDVRAITRLRAFYVDEDNGHTDEVRDGVVWLRDWPGGDEALLITPVGQQLGYSAVAEVLPGLRAGTSVRLGKRSVRPVTHRTYPPSGWGGGPVLALWPDQKFLGRLHDDYRVKAICVVIGSRKDVGPWITATGAVDLRSGHAAAGPTQLDSGRGTGHA